jgi:hypothetical protein
MELRRLLLANQLLPANQAPEGNGRTLRQLQATRTEPGVRIHLDVFKAEDCAA